MLLFVKKQAPAIWQASMPSANKLFHLLTTHKDGTQGELHCTKDGTLIRYVSAAEQPAATTASAECSHADSYAGLPCVEGTLYAVCATPATSPLRADKILFSRAVFVVCHACVLAMLLLLPQYSLNLLLL
jgi:hypothetical protein